MSDSLCTTCCFCGRNNCDEKLEFGGSESIGHGIFPVGAVQMRENLESMERHGVAAERRIDFQSPA